MSGMSPFEFVFSLFGLLLGLSLAELLSGLARTLKQRKAVRLGWLTPLLGLLVMFDLGAFWALAWAIRDAIPANYLTLMIAMVVTGLYFLAATLVFPDEPTQWPDLDAYYFQHKKQVLGGILASKLLARGAQFALGAVGMSYLAAFVLFVALTLALMLVPGRKTNLALLVLFLAMYPAFAFLGLVLRL
jgi:hypothetical protein